MLLDDARPGSSAARRGLAVALVALVAASLGCVHMRGTAEQPAILNLRIEGMKALDHDDLKDRLATHESDRSAPIPIAGPLLHQATAVTDKVLGGQQLKISLVDPDQLVVDRQRIVAYYRERGFYDVKVSEAEVVPTGDRQADVVYRVEEGEPVLVSSIEITGLDAAPEARAALGKLPLEKGDRFTVASYDATRARLLEALKNTGWALAEVAQEAQILPPEHQAKLSYEVEAGPRFKFGPIFVAGAGSVPRDRIREQAGREIRPGDWYDESKLLKAQGQVFDMGVFGGVRVNRGAPDAQRGTIPVVVAVREAPFRTIRAGPALDSEGGLVSGGRVEAVGTVGWTHRNFMGDLRKLDLNLRAGWAWLPNKDRFVMLASSDLTQPGAITKNIDAAIRLEVERGTEEAYDFWSERGRLSFPIHVDRRWTLVPSVSVEAYQIFNGTSIPDPTDPNQPTTLQTCTSALCLLTYLEQRLGWDGRDNPVNTRRGVYAMLSVQEGVNISGLGYQYLRFLPDVRAYFPLGPRVVLAARAQVGALIPVNANGKEPPIVARYFAGGPNSQRGYTYNRLSPMVCEAKSDGTCSTTWVPTGGNGLALYTLEVRFPLRGNLFGAVFGDAGYVTVADSKGDTWQQALDPYNLQLALGAGIRYRTPIGPLRVDVGVRTPDKAVPHSPGADLHHEPLVAVQLVIGEAF